LLSGVVAARTTAYDRPSSLEPDAPLWRVSCEERWTPTSQNSRSVLTAGAAARRCTATSACPPCWRSVSPAAIVSIGGRNTAQPDSLRLHTGW